MANGSPALSVRRRLPHPDPAHVTARKDVPTGWAVDAQERTGVLSQRIRPVSRATRFVGMIRSFGALAAKGARYMD